MDHSDSTLLIVDDEETNRDLLARRLLRKGFRVLEASDGRAALAMIAREKIDLVLLDITMPGLDGIEVLRILRRDHSAVSLPIIMVTARTESQDIVNALDAGANDYVTKPIDFAVTLARIEAQLRLRAAMGGTPVAPALTAVAPVPAVFADPVLTPGRIGPGTVVAGKYQIESRIGSGSFGTVYRARHLGLDIGVAVKVLQKSTAATADARARLRREGISACRIQHPNAVSVMDFGVDGIAVYLVMELLTGRSLEEELALCGRLSVSHAAAIVLPVLSVLAEAHDSGILHRDIKPANVFLHQTSRGEVVKVLDFGIAKIVDDPGLTTVGVVLGTPAYMAPERFTGGLSDGRSDVYSLATMLYQMLAGRLPFVPTSANPIELAETKLRHDPLPLREALPEVSAEVDGLIMEALARDVAKRPTAAQLGQRLGALVGAAGTSARGPVSSEREGVSVGVEKPTEVFSERPPDAD
jgi:CheY-like chemotaxis protein